MQLKQISNIKYNDKIIHKNKVIIPIRALLLLKICDYIVKDKWVQEKTNCPYIKNPLEQLSL